LVAPIVWSLRPWAFLPLCWSGAGGTLGLPLGYVHGPFGRVSPSALFRFELISSFLYSRIRPYTLPGGFVASLSGHAVPRVPPAPRRDDHRLELQPPLGQLVDSRSRGRGEPVAAHPPARSSWRRRWARTLGLAWGRPALRSGKRSGPGSISLATKSAHRSDGTLETVDRARRGTWTPRRS
jgi:hypothetical protein